MVAIDNLRVPREKGKDKRIKLTPEQREWVVENPEGWGSLRLAKYLGVSKRLIQFIRDPEKAQTAKTLFAERQKDGRYYDTKTHRQTAAAHRAHKKQLLETGVLS